MNYILHGENSLLSRQKLNEIVSSFDPSAVSRRAVTANPFFNNQLFAKQEIVLFEFFKKEELRDFLTETFFKDLHDLNGGVQVILWLNFELTPANKLLTQAQDQNFKEFKFTVPPVVFKIADAFFDGKERRANFYKLLADFGSQSGEEIFLLQMIIRSSRLFLWAAFNNQSFQKLKGFTRTQAERGKKFSRVRLERLFLNLIDLEKRIKSGPLDFCSRLLVVYEDL